MGKTPAPAARIRDTTTPGAITRTNGYACNVTDYVAIMWQQVSGSSVIRFFIGKRSMGLTAVTKLLSYNVWENLHYYLEKNIKKNYQVQDKYS